MLKPTKILVPTDFSEYSDKALKQALDIAKEYNAKVYVLHVLDQKLQSTMTGDHSELVVNLDHGGVLVLIGLLFQNGHEVLYVLHQYVGGFLQKAREGRIEYVRRGDAHMDKLRRGAHELRDAFYKGHHIVSGSLLYLKDPISPLACLTQQ